MKKNTTWLTISLGLVGLVATYLIANFLLNENPICHDTKDIFQFYGIAVIIIGGGLTVWTLDKDKVIGRLLLPLTIYAANIFLIYIFFQRISPLPYQLRFTLTNNTNSDLTNIRIAGTKVLKLEGLKNGDSTEFVFNDYEENSTIDLFCTRNNNFDTLNLASGMTNGCGFK